jgi:hypothetical protein
LFDRFQSLDQESAVRLISSDPPRLARFFPSIFAPELLKSAQILGLGLTLGNPVRARLMMQMKSAKAAEDLMRQMRENPQQWLQLEGSDLFLFAQPPEVITQGTDVEVRVVVPENSARLLLQRIAKSNAAPAVAEN